MTNPGPESPLLEALKLFQTKILPCWESLIPRLPEWTGFPDSFCMGLHMDFAFSLKVEVFLGLAAKALNPRPVV